MQVRHYVSNYSTFLRHAALDWEEHFVAAVNNSQEPVPLLRCRVGCAFCARSFWTEEMSEVFLHGQKNFMQNAEAVWQLLSVDRYHQRWPLIPLKELEASAVDVGTSRKRKLVLLHKRRVGAAAVRGEVPVLICSDCQQSFTGKKPTMAKYALANDLWLGRVDPLLWEANVTHEMCLALARTVATKVVLRAGDAQKHGTLSPNQWDHVFQQSGLVGSAVVFHNGDATHAVESLPPRQFNDALAVTFCTDVPEASAEDSAGREVVRRIAHLQLHKARFVKQATTLRETNPVYAEGVSEINRAVLTEWLQEQECAVPPPVLDCVVTVPVGTAGPGKMRQDGPADATEQRTSPDEEPVVFAMEPTVSDFNDRRNDMCNKIVMLLQKLEELEAAGARSVAVEMESLVDEEETLIDHLGRQRILALCQEIQESCRKLSSQELRRKLEGELRDAVMGKSRWFLASESQPGSQTSQQVNVTRTGQSESHAQVGVTSDSEVGVTTELAVPHLAVARGKKPLSLWDWKIWTMSRPRLWRYGDGGNLFERDASLSTTEWAACLLLREETGWFSALR